MKVSYVVTFYNKLKFMRALIGSIKAQTGDFEQELVVADDGSLAEEWQGLKALVADFPGLSIQLVDAEINTGPAQCFNRGLSVAKGDVIVGIDADDVLAPYATKHYIDQLEQLGADFIYGRRRHSTHKKANLTGVELIEDPLDYVIKNQVVHMCFAAFSSVMKEAGGADPRLFIQDQSIPLRLAYAARKMVASEVTTVFINSDEAGLSKNRAQQHYDRFWMAMNFLVDHADLPLKHKMGLMDVGRSALWKMDRDRGQNLFRSKNFWFYIFGRLSGFGPDTEKMKQMASVCFEGADIRKVV